MKRAISVNLNTVMAFTEYHSHSGYALEHVFGRLCGGDAEQERSGGNDRYGEVAISHHRASCWLAHIGTSGRASASHLGWSSHILTDLWDRITSERRFRAERSHADRLRSMDVNVHAGEAVCGFWTYASDSPAAFASPPRLPGQPCMLNSASGAKLSGN